MKWRLYGQLKFFFSHKSREKERGKEREGAKVAAFALYMQNSECWKVCGWTRQCSQIESDYMVPAEATGSLSWPPSGIHHSGSEPQNAEPRLPSLQPKTGFRHGIWKNHSCFEFLLWCSIHKIAINVSNRQWHGAIFYLWFLPSAFPRLSGVPLRLITWELFKPGLKV